MYLYLVGAVHLELNILSYAATHYLDPLASSSSPLASSSSDAASLGAPLAAALLTWFVAEYLYFEDVHLYTYDLFAERVGFKLTWGCLCFYPFFYALPVLAAVGRTSSPSSSAAGSGPGSGQYASATAAAVVYFAGWALSRGANLQKFWFKRSRAGTGSSREGPAASASASTTANSTGSLRSADGRTTLLCGGLWGRARHVNYLGEILEAVGIAMAAGVGTGGPVAVWAAWLYPLYYVGLLVPRERDDDARCREKYGGLWEAYCQRVPWRIVPYVY